MYEKIKSDKVKEAAARKARQQQWERSNPS